MNLLEIFGSIGGALYLIGRIIVIIKSIVEIVRKYYKYERFYEDQSNDEQERTIGFKTEEKKEDEAAEAAIKEYLEKTKVDEGYFNMYWESEPVDDEFIEEEDYEDEEDKYPNLHVER